MKKDIKRQTSGITLISLVITIIVLLILAGISIGMLTGENSIIKNAFSAKENTKIAEEKEILDKATIQAMGKNRYGNLKENELENELNEMVGNGKIKVLLDNEIVSSENSEVNISDYVFEDEDDLDIIVEFIDTNHKYLVSIDGTVSEMIDSETDANTDWEKINYEIRTDENENQYCVVTGLKDGISKTSISVVNIAKKYKGIDVISVEGLAFAGCTNITKIKLPNTLKSIGQAAFYSCNITEIVFPDSLEEIIGNNNGAFDNCQRLEKITFGKGIKKLGSHIFRGCTNLSHVKIPSSITTFGSGVFANCPKLTKVGVGIENGIELESNITEIPASICAGCTNITEITIPDTVIRIGQAAFYSCNITEIVFPDSLEEITGDNNGAFANCQRLENITFGSGIKKLGSNIFRGCTNLSHIKVPSSITNFKYNVFADCPKLTKVGVGIEEGIELESNITEIPALMFYGCTNVTEVTIPDTVINIGQAAFYKCNIIDIKIPDSVERLNGYTSGVFQECNNLENVELGKNVTFLGNKTFYNCGKLKSITYKGNEYSTEASLKAAGVTYIGTESFTGTGIATE